MDDPRKAELQSLLEQREALDRRILALRKTLDSEPGALQRRQALLEPEGEFAGMLGRAAGALRAGGVTTHLQLRWLHARHGRRGLGRIRGLGETTLDEIEAWLAARQEVPQAPAEVESVS